jgi:hypothetical protein
MDAEIKEEPVPSHSWLDWLVSSAWAADPAMKKSWNVSLKWKAVPGVEKYKVQIGRTSAFKDIIAEAETDSPQWTWKYKVGMENTKGRVFYRVASISETGEVGQFSQPKAVQIPKHILAAAKAATKTAAAKKPETFPAVVGDEGTPTDAAPGSDLHQEAVKVAEKPKPVPTPAPTPALASAPAPAPAPASAPKPAKAAPRIAPDEKAPEAPASISSWTWRASVNAGIGNLSQKSTATDITSVTMQSAFLRQRVFVAGRLLQKSVEEEKGWNWQLQATFGSFEQADEGRRNLQQKVSAITVKTEAIRWAKYSRDWEIGWGGMLGRGFRFEKDGVQSVVPSSGFSLGPSALAVRNYNYASGLSPRNVGLSLSIPITGIVMGGAYGIEGNVWGEWKLATFGTANWLGLQLEGEGSYARWSKPAGTSTFAWVLWFSPVFHF